MPFSSELTIEAVAQVRIMSDVMTKQVASITSSGGDE